MSEQREKVMQAAEKLVARGKLSQAIREYRKLLRENPNDANMLNRIGDLYARQDKVDEAVALFQKIANAYSRDGFFVKAIAIYKKIIRLDPTQLEVYEQLAELYHRQGLVSEARSQYQVLAQYYQNHGDTAATIEVHRKMADLEPSDPSPRVKLAELYLSENLVEEAIGEYQRIAEVMLDHDRVDEATKVYLRALDVDSGDLAFVSEAVLRLREDGHEDAAARVFDAAVALNPEAAKLAERMKEHETEEVEPDEPGPEPETPALDLSDPDSVDVADVIGRIEEELPESEPESEPEPEAAASDAATETTADGAFVIDLEEAAAEGARPEEELFDELEIDLSELETPAAEPGPRAAAEPEGDVEQPADEAEAPAPEPERPAAPQTGGGGEALSSIDALEASLGIGETTGAAPAQRSELDELLAEAEVFGKYGLKGKAVRRLERALELAPRNFEAHRRLVMLHLERGVEADVIRSAERLLADAELGGDRWDQVLGALANAGYVVEDDRVLSGSEAAAESGAEASEAAPGATEAPASATPTEEAATAGDEAAEDDEGLEWLEEAVRGKETSDEALFDVEEEFLDLAAELEKEISPDKSSAPEGGEAVTAGNESLEEIVQGFKQGVAEVLSAEAYDTHYNLGIAYREMGLVDEAIGEFQLSAKDPSHLVDSCSMLGACFLEKGFPDLAIKWYKRGLESPGIDEDDSLGLLYDLGEVYAASGDRENAYETFVEIYGVNSHYRDVVARLEELRGG